MQRRSGGRSLGSVYRLDPLTFEGERMPVGAEVLGVAVDEAADSLWVYVGESSDPSPE